jgi:hypothetical protein
MLLLTLIGGWGWYRYIDKRTVKLKSKFSTSKFPSQFVAFAEIMNPACASPSITPAARGFLLKTILLSFALWLIRAATCERMSGTALETTIT